MMKIITQKKISHTGLFRRGFQSRMRIHSAHECQPSRIGNTRNSCFAIIIFQMMDEPVDRIPGIGTFIN